MHIHMITNLQSLWRILIKNKTEIKDTGWRRVNDRETAYSELKYQVTFYELQARNSRWNVWDHTHGQRPILLLNPMRNPGGWTQWRAERNDSIWFTFLKTMHEQWMGVVRGIGRLQPSLAGIRDLKEGTDMKIFRRKNNLNVCPRLL